MRSTFSSFPFVQTPRALAAVALLCGALGGCATQGAAPQDDAARATRDGAGERSPDVQALTAENSKKNTALSSVDAGHSAIKNEVSGPTSGNGAQAPKPKPKADDGVKLIPGSGVFVKPAAPQPPPTGAGAVTLNFEGADLREVVRVMLGDMLKENYTVDPRVNGSVTIHTSQPVNTGAILSVLETVLRMNNAALVRENGIYRVAPIAVALRGGTVPQVGALAPGYGVQVVQLRYVAAREMAKILEPLVPEGSIIRVDETRNLLMLSGSEAERRQAQETIGVFDVDWLAGMSVGLFNLQSVSVKDILPELEALFGDKAKSPFGGLVRVIPIERMNALFVATPQPQYLEQARVWVERLDRNGGKSGTRLFVYPVQNGKAERIAALLSQVLGDGKNAASATPKAQVAPGLTGTTLNSGGGTGLGSTGGTGSLGSTNALSSAGGGLPAAATTAGAGVVASGSAEALGLGAGSKIKVIADPDNNALLIMANAAEYERIEEAVKKLDVVPRQVLVEVTIAEVTLTGALNYGLEWFFSGNGGVTGMLFNSDNKSRALPDTPTGTVSPKMPFSAVWRGSTGNIKAVLSALAANTKVNIISSPHIMVTDNQVARINVGSSVPVAGGSTQTGTTVTTSVSYVDTGVLLTVRPHINAGGLVNLEINQEVSDVQVGVTTEGLNSPTINKRSAQTTVAVQSGDTMVLGGLIKEDKTNGSSGLPGLSEIPVFGALFGTKTNNDTRRELIITITPKVVNDNQEARDVTAEFRRKLSGLRSFQKPAPAPASTTEAPAAPVQ